MYLASQIRSSLYTDKIYIIDITLLFFSFVLADVLVKAVSALPSQFAVKLQILNLLTILPTLAHIFRLWTNRFFVHWTHLPFDFFIRKSHGFLLRETAYFYSVIFAPSLYSDGRSLFMRAFRKFFESFLFSLFLPFLKSAKRATQ